MQECPVWGGRALPQALHKHSGILECSGNAWPWQGRSLDCVTGSFLGSSWLLFDTTCIADSPCC